MKIISTQTLSLKEAYKRGYRVNSKGQVIGIKNNILSLSFNKYGYASFNIRFNKKVTRVFVHRLQAYQKFGESMFEEGILVRHLDGNSKNNSENNILIGTNSDNMMDKSELSRKLGSSSPKHNHKQILEDYNNGMNYTEIMSKHNISSKGTVSFIINSSIAKEGLK